MPVRVAFKGCLLPDGARNVRRRHLAFFGQGVGKHRQMLAVKEVEYAVLDPPPSCPQLIHLIPEVIRFWAAEFVPHCCQALDAGDTFRICAPIAPVERAEPLEHRHTLVLILVEHHRGLEHPYIS